MARQLPAGIGLGDAARAAQQRNHSRVEERHADHSAAVGERVVHHLARLGIEQSRLRRSHAFPRLDRVGDDWIDGFAVRRRGLVWRHVEKDHGAFGQHLIRSWDASVARLPPHAANPQPPDLVAAIIRSGGRTS